MNDAYQDFDTKFLPAVDSVSPIRTLRVKSNTKPLFDIDVLNVIPNLDKLYKKFKQARKLKKTILNIKNFHLRKLLIIRKNFTFRKKMPKIRIIRKNSGEL